MPSFKFWPFLIFALGMFVIAFQSTATAASPERHGLTQASQNGVTLDINSHNEIANIGEILSYTLVITNSSAAIIEPTLSNPIPAPFILKTQTISASMGSVSHANNTISWAGTIPAGQHVEISYSVIPPSLSSTGETIVNVATVTFSGGTLKAEKSLITQVAYHGITWSFLRPIVNVITIALMYLEGFLVKAHIPYAYGFSIILFTVIIRLATFPLNMQQIKSAKAMQQLQPKMKALQDKYKDDREALAAAQMKMYSEAGVNPLGGCLPMLIQMPVWISLYWALIQLSLEDLLTEGFFWIPSLAGPVSYNEGSIGWLWPLPPHIGWGPALAYMVLPILLVVSQMYMQEMMTPPSTDPQQAQMQSMMRFMPLMFGYFALVVPSGLTLYWFVNNLLMMAQQHFTQTNLQTPAVATVGGGTVEAPSLKKSDWSTSTNNNSKEGTSDATKRKSKHKR